MDVCPERRIRSRARDPLENLRERQRQHYVSPVDLAQVELGLGNTDAAMNELEEAYRTRAMRTVVIGDPFFSELAADERYRQLLSRLRLPLQTTALV